MKKRVIPIILFVIYGIILIKVFVFKDVPTIKVGQIMLQFSGTESGYPPNFIPFKTIVPYLFGYKGWIIAGINLVGNILPLIPLGFLLPLINRSATWKKALALGVVVALVIETMQTVLHVGIFDIDDVILNTIGVLIGYVAFVLLMKWIRERKYLYIVGVVVVLAVLVMGVLHALRPKGPVVSPLGDSKSSDLCGGTGGNGEIVGVGDNTVTLKRNDGTTQAIHFTKRTTVKTPTGDASVSDLKTGERITMVGGPNPDGSFTADAVFVCSATPVQ